MQTTIPKKVEVSVPKFDFGYPDSRKHEVIGKSDPVVLEKIVQEQKVLSLYAPSVTALIQLVIPFYEFGGWKADVSSIQKKSKDETPEEEKLSEGTYQVMFRRTTIKFNH